MQKLQHFTDAKGNLNAYSSQPTSKQAQKDHLPGSSGGHTYNRYSVLAAYLGPNRTRTEQHTSCDVILYQCQYIAAKGVYRNHQIDSWSCSNEGKPWQSYPSQSSGCDSGSVGDKYWDKKDTVDEVTTTYPSATIAGVLQNCTLKNGWCTTSPQLSLSGYEPVSGYGILGIEGNTE